MVDRRERRGLLLQPGDQILRKNLGAGARNVVDRLFGIECRALGPPTGVEGVDDMTTHVEHARLEDLEEADRPRTHHDNVGLVPLAHR